MWKANLHKSIKELRFVLKQSPQHHGVWNYVQNKLPQIQLLNQNTFFAYSEINDNFETPSACHVIYGDSQNRVDSILSENLTSAEFEKILMEKVAIGATLTRQIFNNNDDRDLPTEIIEARKHVVYLDDRF